MTFDEVRESAKKNISNCKACPVCNGLGCGNTIPGPGSKAPGNGANVNWSAWQKIGLNMDVFAPDGAVDTGCELFGAKLKLPLLSGPIGSLTQYSKTDVTLEYNDGVIEAAAKCGFIDCFGDGVTPQTLPGGLISMEHYQAAAVPILNPFPNDVILKHIEKINKSSAVAVGVVADSAGLSVWTGKGLKFGSKTPDEMKELRAASEKPFIVKGIMTAKNAEQAVACGADGIIVSNHGGRVLPGAPATAEVLPEIVAAVGGAAKIIVDGGLRSGSDILKALAMGADAVMICRPFPVAWFGAGAEGVTVYVEKLRMELVEAMYMCGARKLTDISPEMVRV